GPGVRGSLAGANNAPDGRRGRRGSPEAAARGECPIWPARARRRLAGGERGRARLLPGAVRVGAAAATDQRRPDPPERNRALQSHFRYLGQRRRWTFAARRLPESRPTVPGREGPQRLVRPPGRAWLSQPRDRAES